MFLLRRRSRSASSLPSAQKSELKSAMAHLNQIADLEKNIGELEQEVAGAVLRFSARDRQCCVAEVGRAFCHLYQLWAAQRHDLAARLQAAAKELSHLSSPDDSLAPLQKQLSAAAQRVSAVEKKIARARNGGETRLLSVDLEHAKNERDRCERIFVEAERSHDRDRVEKFRMFIQRCAGAYGFAARCNEIVFRAGSELADELPDLSAAAAGAGAAADCGARCRPGCAQVVAAARQHVAQWHSTHGTPRKQLPAAATSSAPQGRARGSLSSPPGLTSQSRSGGGAGSYGRPSRKRPAAASSGSELQMDVDVGRCCSTNEEPPPYEAVESFPGAGLPPEHMLKVVPKLSHFIKKRCHNAFSRLIPETSVELV